MALLQRHTYVVYVYAVYIVEIGHSDTIECIGKVGVYSSPFYRKSITWFVPAERGKL